MKQTKKHILHNFVNTARKYIDTPYFYKGRGKGGIDCAGLIIVSLSASIIPNYSFNNYNTNPNPKHVRKELLSISDQVYNLEHGNILLLNLNGLPNHIAIYTEDNTIIHSYELAGKVVEEKFTTYWNSKLDSIYKVRI